MFENLFRLDGKVAVVTGAGNGLGRSFALGLAAFGATVICADKNLDGADETASLVKQSRGKARRRMSTSPTKPRSTTCGGRSLRITRASIS